MPDREQVRASAKYLRGVRPIDPEELAEYVDGGLHPAVVRQLLREEAVDLGVVEREDGSFVPAPEGSFEPAFERVEALPEAYDRALADLLVERYGPGWHRGDSGERLRATLHELKADYHRGHPVEYDADRARAYAVYHLAGYYAATQYVLDELGGDGLLDHRLRVLEVGAGAGGPALGLAEYLAAGRCCESHRALIDYHAVEPAGAMADIFETLADETPPGFHPTVHRETAAAFDPDGEFDLVVFANVASELEAPADVVERYLDTLTSDGTAVVLAPADRRTSVGLRDLERSLADERGVATVYAPTVRLWSGEHPTDEGWSFDARPGIEEPATQAQLAAGADDPETVTNTGVRFSYALLRVDGRRRHDVALSRERAAPMADAAENVTERVDLVAAKLSHDLSEGGNPVFKLSDGSESTGHYAVLVNETALNRTLRTAPYGALLRIEGGLVLYNDDEAAYNVVVDEESVVD